jgi:hypothetical protein
VLTAIAAAVVAALLDMQDRVAVAAALNRTEVRAVVAVAEEAVALLILFTAVTY